MGYSLLGAADAGFCLMEDGNWIEGEEHFYAKCSPMLRNVRRTRLEKRRGGERSSG